LKSWHLDWMFSPSPKVVKIWQNNWLFLPPIDWKKWQLCQFQSVEFEKWLSESFLIEKFEISIESWLFFDQISIEFWTPEKFVTFQNESFAFHKKFGNFVQKKTLNPKVKKWPRH